jgi:2-methylcitrate dehydratase PrpD
MTHTTILARHAASLQYDTLPPGVVQAAKRATLDLLGVIFPAVQYRPGQVMNAYIARQGGTPDATVIGTSIRTSTAQAALANGTMAAEMELDDVHPESGTHPGSVYVPAMLAVAERIDSSGKDWIAALVGAYDVGCKLAMAMGYARQYSRGFHATGVSGIFGGAAGAARLLGLDAAGMESAFGLAGCQAAGLLIYEMEQEHFTKSFQSGVPARNAVVAAELAADGYIGAPGSLDGHRNVFNAFSTAHEFEKMTADLGTRYEIEHTGYKFYAACRAIHSPLDVLLELSTEHGFAAGDIDEVNVWLPPDIVPVVDDNVLTTHNLQYIMAAGLVDRSITRIQTGPERRADSTLNALARRVTLRPDTELAGRYPEIGMLGPSRTAVKLQDGRAFEVERDSPKGSNARPVSDREIEDKFLQMATQVIPQRQAEDIVAVVRNLEALSSIRELAALLTAK